MPDSGKISGDEVHVRQPLPKFRLNGGTTDYPPVYVISGMVANPHFRFDAKLLQAQSPEDELVVFLGSSMDLAWPEGGDEGNGEELEEPEDKDEDEDGEEDGEDFDSTTLEPSLILRRFFDKGEVAVLVRIEAEGVFMLLSNDDEQAESLFQALLQPCEPDEVYREWTPDTSVAKIFHELLTGPLLED